MCHSIYLKRTKDSTALFFEHNSMSYLAKKVNVFFHILHIVFQLLMVFFRIFSVLSAILYLGNVTYEPKDVGEGLKVGPDCVLSAISDLLKVPLATLAFKINSSQEAEPLYTPHRNRSI